MVLVVLVVLVVVVWWCARGVRSVCLQVRRLRRLRGWRGWRGWRRRRVALVIGLLIVAALHVAQREGDALPRRRRRRGCGGHAWHLGSLEASNWEPNPARAHEDACGLATHAVCVGGWQSLVCVCAFGSLITTRDALISQPHRAFATPRTGVPGDACGGAWRGSPWRRNRQHRQHRQHRQRQPQQPHQPPSRRRQQRRRKQRAMALTRRRLTPSSSPICAALATCACASTATPISVGSCVV